eukprot:NODE_135_length_16508_cov_1.365897.p2 type:complete len:508 gc:universal NODE_135_length_16508_cov_1.365897:2733-4256(+)
MDARQSTFEEYFAEDEVDFLETPTRESFDLPSIEEFCESRFNFKDVDFDKLSSALDKEIEADFLSNSELKNEDSDLTKIDMVDDQVYESAELEKYTNQIDEESNSSALDEETLQELDFENVFYKKDDSVIPKSSSNFDMRNSSKLSSIHPGEAAVANNLLSELIQLEEVSEANSQNTKFNEPANDRISKSRNSFSGLPSMTRSSPQLLNSSSNLELSKTNISKTDILSSSSAQLAVPSFSETISPEYNHAVSTKSKVPSNLPPISTRSSLLAPKKNGIKRSSYYMGHLENQDNELEKFDTPSMPYRSATVGRKDSFQTKFYKKKENIQVKFFSFKDELENKPGSTRARSLICGVVCCFSIFALLILLGVVALVFNIVLGAPTASSSAISDANLSGGSYNWIVNGTIKNDGFLSQSVSLSTAVLVLEVINANGPKPQLSPAQYYQVLLSKGSSNLQFNVSTTVIGTNMASICQNKQNTFANLKLSFSSSAILVIPKNFDLTFKLPCPK